AAARIERPSSALTVGRGFVRTASLGLEEEVALGTALVGSCAINSIDVRTELARMAHGGSRRMLPFFCGSRAPVEITYGLLRWFPGGLGRAGSFDAPACGRRSFPQDVEFFSVLPGL